MTTPAKYTVQTQNKLPIGIQDFRIIREQGYIYVDKTQDIYRLLTEGMMYFLSRPRRFGKSLLVSTLKYIFQGEKELFEGLWIAEQREWEWEEHPVILLDFSEISNASPDEFQSDLAFYLSGIASSYDVKLPAEISLTSQFRELILSLYRKTGKRVVILIDEYDKALIDHLGQGREELEIAKENRAILKRFFGVLKGGTVASSLRLVFLTGISRFSKISIFSELNNLDDISTNAQYAGFLGYTEEELKSCFSIHLDGFAEHLEWPKDRLLAKLEKQYNGYRFSESLRRVYNPFSVLKAFSEKKFGNFWFQTGTPTFLLQLLKQEEYELPDIEGLEVGQAVFDNYDLERLAPEALLFQIGYLTIKGLQKEVYTLDYPNQEVKRAFTESLKRPFVKSMKKAMLSHIARAGNNSF